MNEVLIIPTDMGEIFVFRSIIEAKERLGVTVAKIKAAINTGTEVRSNDRTYCLDYEINPLELTKDSQHKYELISEKDNSVHKFKTCKEIAHFCERSSKFVGRRKADGSLLKSRCGEIYRLRVMAINKKNINATRRKPG